MEKVKFNNEEECEQYFKESDITGGFCCSGFYKRPTHYPCILVWSHHDDGDDAWNIGKYIYKEDLI